MARTTPTAAAFAARALLHARVGQFREAADDFASAFALDPGDQEIWHQGVAVHLYVGDEPAYRRYRTRELRRFAAAPGNIAHRVAKDCLVIPADEEELALAAKLADRALEEAPESGWSFQTKGMAEYRRGHYAEAIAWLDRAVGVENQNDWRDAVCAMFLAMAHQRAGHPYEARVAFDRGVRLMQTLPRGGDDDLGGMVGDWCVCQCARREAEATMAVAPPATRRATRDSAPAH